MTTQRTLVFAAAALIFASSAFAQGSNKPPAKAPASTASTTANAGTFKSLDKNGNGYIDRSEAQGALAAAFSDLDTNKDGKLSSAEYRQHK